MSKGDKKDADDDYGNNNNKHMHGNRGTIGQKTLV